MSRWSRVRCFLEGITTLDDDVYVLPGRDGKPCAVLVGEQIVQTSEHEEVLLPDAARRRQEPALGGGNICLDVPMVPTGGPSRPSEGNFLLEWAIGRAIHLARDGRRQIHEAIVYLYLLGAPKAPRLCTITSGSTVFWQGRPGIQVNEWFSFDLERSGLMRFFPISSEPPPIKLKFEAAPDYVYELAGDHPPKLYVRWTGRIREKLDFPYYGMGESS